MAIDDEGEPSNWTLRFKHGRITLLLYTESTTPFSVLISELLEALRERYPDGLPSEGTSKVLNIPESHQDVQLGMLQDVHDTSRGWKDIELQSEGDMMVDSPQNVGLRDQGMVAFRFMTEETRFNVKLPSYDEAYPDQQDLEDDEEIEAGDEQVSSTALGKRRERGRADDEDDIA